MHDLNIDSKHVVENTSLVTSPLASPACGEVTGEVSGEPTGQDEAIDNEEVNKVTTGQVNGQVTGQVSEEVKRVIFVIDNELRSAEIQNILQLKYREYFRENYLLPALESGLIEMTFSDSPNHPNQRYRLTEKGSVLKRALEEHKKKK